MGLIFFPFSQLGVASTLSWIEFERLLEGKVWSRFLMRLTARTCLILVGVMSC